MDHGTGEAGQLRARSGKALGTESGERSSRFLPLPKKETSAEVPEGDLSLKPQLRGQGMKPRGLGMQICSEQGPRGLNP